MSAEKKRNHKKLLFLIVLVALVAAVCLMTLGRDSTSPEETETEPRLQAITAPAQVLDGRILKEAIRINSIEEYVGAYVEDGSDEAVAGLLMMEVTNISEEPIQFAQIELQLDGETAKFNVSVLPAGATAVLIEQDRMEYDETVDYAGANAECVHLAGFERPLSLQENSLTIQVLDGAANIINISDAPIEGIITICYKNVANGVYHGGIAYRIRIEGGLKAGELKQIMAAHLYQGSSEILFVDIAQ